jgi:hypothetical protein
MTKRALVLLAIVVTGCAGPATAPPTTGELSVTEESGRASGYFIDRSHDLGRVDFVSHFVDTNVLDVEVRFHGLTLTWTVDYDSGVIEYDGFTSSNGANTQILEDDRALLLSFTRALDARGAHVGEPLSHVRSFTSTWAEFPASLDPQGQSLIQQNRSYTSLCSRMNTYYPATHDCWSGACPHWDGCHDWDDASTLDGGAWLAMNGAGPCSDGTYFWTGSWTCYEPDHDPNIEYGYGDCFGRCGADCGSGTQFTVDCVNHDQCVRFGHDIASAWCDGEFSATIDDAASAPNC